MDASFEKLSGLKDVISGHADGQTDHSGLTGKVEAIKIIYDPNSISYSEMLDYYIRQFDPTDVVLSNILVIFNVKGLFIQISIFAVRVRSFSTEI